jgi:hypothetical protein
MGLFEWYKMYGALILSLTLFIIVMFLLVGFITVAVAPLWLGA